MNNAFNLALGGYNVTHSPNPNHPESVYFSADIGAVAQLRQPASMRPLFDKLASGEPVALSDADRDHVQRIGIVLNDATLEVREREAFKLLAAGVPVVEINARRTAPHYKPTKPVRITGSFIPTKASY